MPGRRADSSILRFVLVFMVVAAVVAAGAWFLVAVAAPPGPRLDQDQVVAAAEQYLRACGRYPEAVTRVEVVAGEGDANHYWDAPDAPLSADLKKVPCWVVTFYYEDIHPDQQLIVYVDRKTGEAIGGMQCK